MRKVVRSLLILLTGASVAVGGSVVSPAVAAAPSVVIPPAASGTGTIAGRVTATDGAGLADVTVRVFSGWRKGDLARIATTAADGSYEAAWLPPADDYLVCFDARTATGGSARLGYASQCWRYKAWTPVWTTPGSGGPATPAIGSQPVRVEAGVVTDGIDVQLIPASSVSGQVTAADGSPIPGVSVKAGGALPVVTGDDGTYTIVGLDPTVRRLRVCFEAPAAATDRYASQCYRDAPWNPGFDAATRLSVPLTAGADTPGIDAVLLKAGSIAGTVTAADGGAALDFATVTALDAAGGAVQRTNTAADGSYTLTGLRPTDAGYRVCFVSGDLVELCTPDVPVTAGSVTDGTDAALTAAPPADQLGTITGVVSAAGGAALPGASVVAFRGDGRIVGTTFTGADGTYSIGSLAPSTQGYVICVGPTDAAAPAWIGQCVGSDAPWIRGQLPPPVATFWAVGAGETVTGVDQTLQPSAGLAGRVTTAANGVPLRSAAVVVFTADGKRVRTLQTDAVGAFRTVGLEPATDGYILCFDATFSSDQNTPGYAPQCSGDVAWVPSTGVPAPGATTVTVLANTVTTGIEAALAPAGAVFGSVTVDGTGAALPGIRVRVYGPDDTFVAATTTAADGTWTVGRLAPSDAGYTACFRDTGTQVDAPVDGYASQCFDGQPWYRSDPLPASAQRVPVTAKTITSGVGAVMEVSRSGITGRVTSAADGSGVAGVSVYAFDSAGRSAVDYDNNWNLRPTVTTGADGSYRLTGIGAPTDGFTVCFAPGSDAGTPTYLGACVGSDTPWQPGEAPTVGSVPVPVDRSGLTDGVDIALRPAAG